ncbi:hypothetical protein [Paenibacillus whitsoniae]|uniref:hypothetical protein n=1 Tax=Paenibacillus whitsoniae TaxID=2496558 RepID=UPI0013DF2F6C|nr:hypothetical protein [Paenibacillus whitsoniae]
MDSVADWLSVWHIPSRNEEEERNGAIFNQLADFIPSGEREDPIYTVLSKFDGFRPE